MGSGWPRQIWVGALLSFGAAHSASAQCRSGVRRIHRQARSTKWRESLAVSWSAVERVLLIRPAWKAFHPNSPRQNPIFN